MTLWHWDLLVTLPTEGDWHLEGVLFSDSTALKTASSVGLTLMLQLFQGPRQAVAKEGVKTALSSLMAWGGQLCVVSEHIVHFTGSSALLVMLWSILSVPDSHPTPPQPFSFILSKKKGCSPCKGNLPGQA